MTKYFPGRNSKQLSYRYNNLLGSKANQKWNKEDDLKLMKLVDDYGEDFDTFCMFFPKRSSKDIAARYYKKIKHQKITRYSNEDNLILKLYFMKKLSLQDIKELEKKEPLFISVRLSLLLKSIGSQPSSQFHGPAEIASRIALLKAEILETSNLEINFNMHSKALDKNLIKCLSQLKEKKDHILPAHQEHDYFIENRESFDTMSPTLIFKNYTEDSHFQDALSFDKPSISNCIKEISNNPSVAYDDSGLALITNSYTLDEDTLNLGFGGFKFMKPEETFEYSLDDLESPYMNKCIEGSDTINQENAHAAETSNKQKIVEACLEKKSSLESALSKLNHISCSLEKELYGKLNKISISNLSKLKSEEVRLFQQMAQMKSVSLDLSKILNLELVNELISNLTKEIDVLLNLIQISKLKLEVLNFCLSEN